MTDYEKMYTILFRETTKVILALQKAQQQTEDIYISDNSIDNSKDINPDGQTNNDT